MKQKGKRISGVFPHLVNSSAFIDTIDIQVWGLKRVRTLDHISATKNRAIGGPRRFYTRGISGRNRPTSNRFQFRYGVTRPYKNLSPFSVRLWAHRLPVTSADAMLVIEGFVRGGCRTRISQIELTFDTAGIPLESFTRELCTTARSFREFESERGTTVYAGGVNSSWQLKIYQKTHTIVRIEFTLRNMFLRRHGVTTLHQASLLRKARLWDQRLLPRD